MKLLYSQFGLSRYFHWELGGNFRIKAFIEMGRRGYTVGGKLSSNRGPRKKGKVRKGRLTRRYRRILCPFLRLTLLFSLF